MAENYRFGGGAAETTLSPVVLVAMLVAIVLILVVPRRFMIVPFLTISFLVPLGQTVVLGGVHLFVARILILFGFARLVGARFTGKTKVFGRRWNKIDKVFMAWALCRAATFMLQYARMDAAVNQIGFLWDTLGGYLFLRFAIQDEEDIRRATKVFALIAIVVGFCMVVEQRSLSNAFGAIGGRLTPEIRAGRPRSQGPFSHAILAGVFGATIMPLFVRLWLTKKDRSLAAAGVVGATTMVLASASSTPVGAYAAGILGVCAWPFRRNMRVIRWGMVAIISALALVMKAPVWFLLAHLDFVGGSSGYHRAMLVDQAVRRFWDWWLLGANNNQNWGWDMWDIQNQFVAEALRGGLAAFVLFVLLVSRAFGRVGAARKLAGTDLRQAWCMWALGAMIFAHVVAFFGADYFDQTRFWWFTSLAMISAATGPAPAKINNASWQALTRLRHSTAVAVTVAKE